MKKQDDAGECVFPLPGAGLRDGGSFLVDFVNPDCPQNAAGLEVGAAYEFEQENGFSVCNNLREYSAWLEELVDLIGFDEAPDEHGPGPFRELILYGGLGEIIGPVASAKLVADFVEWDERARSLGDDAFYELYARIRKVFEYAGEAGAVWSEGETYR
ncbi:hypothetical protein SNK19_05860 [Ralstonia pseudosolanacearum]|uniref:hypothetical protein n=1 Tax=Ralstonia pseudosolanacearum TaxID=1310165 RepID=UPI003CFB6294